MWAGRAHRFFVHSIMCLFYIREVSELLKRTVWGERQLVKWKVLLSTWSFLLNRIFPGVCGIERLKLDSPGHGQGQREHQREGLPFQNLIGKGDGFPISQIDSMSGRRVPGLHAESECHFLRRTEQSLTFLRAGR